MDKAIKILEKYVEWIALSLGGLFLLWMIWSYLITPRVTVEIPGEGVVTPGEIDEKIVEGPVQKLQAAMNDPRVPEMKMTDYSVALVNTLKGPQTVAALIPNPWNTLTQPGVKVQDPGVGPDQPGVEVVQQLPQPLPAPEPLGVRYGRSLVQVPIMNANAQPGQPAPVENVDKDWVSVFYRIPTKPIADLFRKHAIPDMLYQTTVLDIELVRQEMRPDGTWGNDETVIEPLPIHNVPPFPAANNRTHQHSYQQWAEANQATLLQPSFYQWIEGNQWAPLQAVADQQPVQPEGERPPTLDERRQQHYERTQKQREERQPRQPTPRRAPSRRGGNEGEFAPSPGPTGGGYRAPLDGERLAQNTPRRGQAPGPRRLAPPDFDPGNVPQDYMEDLGPGAGMPAPAQQPQMAGVAPLPPGQFDPNTAPPIEGWAHDDTIEPGKTYRYRVVYRLRNPMFGQINRVKDQKMAEQFDLVSDASEWSEPVSIPAKTQFFVAGVNHIKNVARFDVFNWQTGKWQKLTEEYGPGDLIGAKNNNDAFANGWSVVDIRRDATGEFQVIVVDPSGNLHVRDSRTDRNNPEYRRLQQEIAQANVEPMAGGR